MANIIPTRREYELNLFFDLDGTLKDHSNIEKKLYRLLIPSSINQKASIYRKLLTTASNITAPFSQARAFEDLARIPQETSEFASNTLYTLNSPKAIRYFLQKSGLEGGFDKEISLAAKNPQILTEMLREYQENPENSLAVLIGDAIVDIKNTYDGKSISIALEGPLERKQGELESISDMYIPEIDRQNPDKVRFKIYNRIDREMDEFGISKKEKARQGIIQLRDRYESRLENSVN
jgi:hypothetical protein